LYKIATHKPAVEAEIVLALSEAARGESVACRSTSCAGTSHGAAPDDKIKQLIVHAACSRSRRKLGANYAVEEHAASSRSKILEEHRSTATTTLSTRRGSASSPGHGSTRAYGLARDLAADRDRDGGRAARADGKQLTNRTSRCFATGSKAAERDSRARLPRKTRGRGCAKLPAMPSALRLATSSIGAAGERARRGEPQARRNHAEPDSVADRIAAAGLDVTIGIVEEHKPQARITARARDGDRRGWVRHRMGTALILGARSTRAFTTPTTRRAGLAVLGHLPGFPGAKRPRNTWRSAPSCS